jgi:hypothetical protein
MENVKLVLTMQYLLAAEMARENACFLTLSAAGRISAT